SASTIQVSSCAGSVTVYAPAAPAATGWTPRLNGGIEKLTTTAPEVFRNWRRERVCALTVFIASSPPVRGGAPDRAQNARVGAAAADQAREGRPDLRVARMGSLVQERRGRHDPPVDAVPALHRLL